MTWQSALRTLMIFHKLTHMQGDAFVDFLTHKKIDALNNFQVPKTPVSKKNCVDFVLATFIRTVGSFSNGASLSQILTEIEL